MACRTVLALAIALCLSARPGALAPVAFGAASQWVTPAVEAPGLQWHTFHSVAVGSKVSYHIYLPPVYHEDNQRRFPVLYYLHGSLGGLRGLKYLAAYFGAAIEQRKIPPMLVVFPNSPPLSMWCDSKDGRTPVETVLIHELIPHVDATFRTIASRRGRAVEGFSMGGYGAARLGFRYPEQFRAISMLAAGPLQPDFPAVGPRTTIAQRLKVFREVYGGDPDYFLAQSPWALAEKNADRLRRDTIIRMVIGDRDETLEINRRFHAHLTHLRIPHAFIVLPGVDHDPRKLLRTLGDRSWSFYRAAFGSASANPLDD